MNLTDKQQKIPEEFKLLAKDFSEKDLLPHLLIT